MVRTDRVPLPVDVAGLRPWPAVDSLTVEQKVGHLILVEIPETQMTAATTHFLHECHPAGVALFGRNLAGPWATSQLTADLQDAAQQTGDAPLLLGIDQEGGLVSHLRYPCAEVPGAMACAAAGGP